MDRSRHGHQAAAWGRREGKGDAFLCALALHLVALAAALALVPAPRSRPSPMPIMAELLSGLRQPQTEKTALPSIRTPATPAPHSSPRPSRTVSPSSTPATPARSADGADAARSISTPAPPSLPAAGAMATTGPKAATVASAPASGAGPVPAPPSPATPTLVPPAFNAGYLDNPAPTYPSPSRRSGEQGRVLLRVRVSAQGLAEEVHVQASSGHARLDAAALEAVRRWRFVPATRGDERVPAWVQVPISFRLEG